jgi:translation elongation factor EF-1alpha
MELPDKKKIISDAFPCVMHMHCIQEEVEIKKVKSSLDEPSRKGKIFLKSQERGIVQITVSNFLAKKNSVRLRCALRSMMNSHSRQDLL